MFSLRLTLVAFVFVLSGCSSLSYYSQAVSGHMEVMRAARPIAEVIEDPACDSDLRKKLQEITRVRDFASRQLGLPDNNSYRSYADLGRPYVTWNVFAAPEFSLKPESWCLLVVGCIGYRGFYDQNEAEAFADTLRQQGFDTYVGGTAAYSTLGYFSDPVLNTFLKSGGTEEARLIFHELAHQVAYAEGDTVFNESFATAVENEGLRRWLIYKANPKLDHNVAIYHQRKAAFFEHVNAYRKKLQEIYASNKGENDKRRAKTEILAEMKQSYLEQQEKRGAPPIYKPWFEKDLNNAKLASLALYTQLLPAFEELLAEENYDLPSFYQRVKALSRLPHDDRQAAIRQLEKNGREKESLAQSGNAQKPLTQ